VRRYGTVAVGGTFDRFHIGHEALLATAFRAGRAVAIGLTTPEFLSAHPKPRGRAIASVATRRRALTRWLRRNQPGRRWTIVPLRDRFGRSVEEGVDALVVSADTVRGGREVNRERARRGLRPLSLLVVPLVLADDLRPVSSRRIRAGEIGPHGERRATLRVGVAVAREEDRTAVQRALRRSFPSVRTRKVRWRAASGSFAVRARRQAREARARADLGLAVTPLAGGWLVAVEGPADARLAQPVAGARTAELAHGLTLILAPSRRARSPGS